MDITASDIGASRKTFLDIQELLSLHPELRIERDSYNINVTSQLGNPLSSKDALTRVVLHNGQGSPAHLYFHVPLCAYVCHFCNYVKKQLPEGEAGRGTLSRWTDLLIEESSRYLSAIPWYRSALIQSVYLGGGTASLLGTRNLEKILTHVRKHYTLSSGCEISLEGNPDNFQSDEIKEAVCIGVNRFSVGVQSLQNNVNLYTGRGHDSDMSLRAIGRLKATGLPFNVDMMFGLPHQTTESVRSDIKTLVNLRVPTVTIYRLRNADRQTMNIGVQALWNVPTIQTRMKAQGIFPSLEDTYQMRDAAVAVLLDSGYQPSPCGWWSLPGTYGEPNIPKVSQNKWMNYDTMIAYGPGAYGWISGHSSELLQTHNSTDIAGHAKFLETSNELPLAKARLLSGTAAVATVLGFAFKAYQPISLCRFRTQFGVDLLNDSPYAAVIARMMDNRFLTLSMDHLWPTLLGEAVHEEIISVYFHRMLGGSTNMICGITNVLPQGQRVIGAATASPQVA